MTLEATIRARRGACELDLALTIGAGETLALVGPNGAGKSTLVDVLAGVWPLGEGRVQIGGDLVEETASKIRRPPAERRIGVVFQGHALFPHLRAVDNVAYGLRARGRPRVEAEEEARRWLDRLGVLSLATCLPGQLSGGQVQAVALARALITGPRLLLLDEPLSALDVRARAGARELLSRTLRDAEVACLMITHDARDALAVADRLVALEAGRITRSGTIDECLADPASDYLAAMLAEKGIGEWRG
ncbi:MAG: ATP-binding cassette domain-containing protein [Nannocystaceae bacterium]